MSGEREDESEEVEETEVVQVVDEVPARTAMFDENPSTGSLFNLERPRPDDRLRRWVLVGIFLTLLTSLTLCGAGLALHWFERDFAETVLQTVVSPVIAASTAIIGYLFAERGR